jgi:hypothetical protein
LFLFCLVYVLFCFVLLFVCFVLLLLQHPPTHTYTPRVRSPQTTKTTTPTTTTHQQHINGTKCGACWAFSAVAVMEITQAMADGPGALVSASEQMLIDCDVKRDHGCDGGGYLNAIRWYE